MTCRGLAAATLLFAIVGCGGGPEPEPRRTLAASTTDPRYVAARQRFVELRGQGDLEGAIRAGETAVNLAPAALEPSQLLLQLFAQVGQEERGRTLFEQMTVAYPEASPPWFARGSCEFRLNRWREAEASFERALELDPQSVGSQFMLGRVRHTLGDFDGALAALERARQLDPRSAQIATYLDRQLRVAGDYVGAERLIGEALRANPDAAELWFAQGQLRIRRGELAPGEAALRRAVELDPTLEQAHRELAALLTRSGREEEGRYRLALAERWLDHDSFGSLLNVRRRLFPEDPAIPLTLARLEISQQRFRQAWSQLQLCERLGGPPEAIAAARALIDAEGGRIERAEAALAGLGDDDGWAELARAAVEARAGRTDAALRHLERAQQVGPGDRLFLRRAADTYALIGRDDRAAALVVASTAAPLPSVPD